MAYSIHKSDGTTVTVADNAIDNDFYNPSGGSTGSGMGIQLIGRNAIGYGAAVAQSFLQVTENFASATGTQPIGSKALQGQLWYDKTIAALYVRITPGVAGADDLAANWQKLVTVNGNQTGNVTITNPAAGTEKDGDIRVAGSVISIWAGGAYRQIFPALYS